jgi:hypothetical protein
MITSFLTKTLLIPLAAAAGDGLDFTLPDPLKSGSSLPVLIGRVFTALVYIAAYIAPIIIIWGAFQILTSGGNAEKYKSGTKAILYAIIGFIIVLAAKGIVDIVGKALSA